MTNGGHQFAGGSEFLRDPQHFRIASDFVRHPASSADEPVKVRRVNSLNRHL